MCSCEDEPTPAGPAAEVQAPPTSNEHTAKWRLYTNKAAQLAREVMGMQHSKRLYVAQTCICLVPNNIDCIATHIRRIHTQAAVRLIERTFACSISWRTQRST